MQRIIHGIGTAGLVICLFALALLVLFAVADFEGKAMVFWLVLATAAAQLLRALSRPTASQRAARPVPGVYDRNV